MQQRHPDLLVLLSLVPEEEVKSHRLWQCQPLFFSHLYGEDILSRNYDCGPPTVM